MFELASPTLYIHKRFFRNSGNRHRPPKSYSNQQNNLTDHTSNEDEVDQADQVHRTVYALNVGIVCNHTIKRNSVGCGLR
ncbi:unnamed protein product [Cylicocyclus nassatus]|uniref:Uncharacterized protein n=1 Tax=Cylicocyclus nassatus TaxID=53992 RepID=A0AA36H032_CYLNA|nr:unnamed protein product [Cylicocyclus nassatus]